MAVAFISSTESERTGTTDPHTFSVTVDAAAKGLLLFIGHGTSSTDHAPATAVVTIGGKRLGKVATATDTATEPGRVDCWFLGHDLPASGVQTVSVDLASGTTDDMHFVVVQLSGSTSLELVDIKTLSDTNGANPSVTLAYGGRTCIGVGMLYTGTATVGTDSVKNANMTTAQLFDIAAFGTSVEYQTTPGTSDFVFSYTAAADDVALVAVAVSEERTSAYRDAVLALSPVGYWRLNEPVGCLTAFDRSPNLRHGIYTGGLTLATTGLITGDSDTAITPNGTTGYVDIADDSAFTIGTTGQLSVIASATLSAADGVGIVGKNAASQYEWDMVQWDAGGLQASIIGSVRVLATGAGIAGVTTTSYSRATHHLAMTIDDTGDVLTVYVDGAASGTPDTTWSGVLSNGTGHLVIGQRGDSAQWFNSPVDEVAVFPDLLTSGEITTLYNTALGVSSQTISPGLINRTGATFAPTVTPGSVTVSLGLINQTGVTFAPSLSLAFSVGLINQTGVTFAPTVTPGSVTVSPGLINQTAVVFAPTVTPTTTLPLGLINQTAVVFAPTVTPGSVSITPALLTNSPTLFAPTVTPGAFTVSLPLIANTATVFAPTLTPGAVSITPALLTAPTAVFAPTVTPGAVTVSLPLITNTPTLFQPSVSISFGLGLITNTPTVHAPTVTPGAVSITPGLITAPTATFAPTLTPGSFTVSLPIISSVGTPFAPIVSVQGANAIPTIDNPPTVFAPVITAGSVTVALGFISNPATPFAPTVAPGAVTVTVPLISNAPVVHAPQLSAFLVLPLPLIDQTAIVHAPTVLPGSVTVQVPLIDRTAVAFAFVLTNLGLNVPGTVVPSVGAAPGITPSAGARPGITASAGRRPSIEVE